MNTFAALLLLAVSADEFQAGVYPVYQEFKTPPAFRETIPPERFPRVVFFTQKSCTPCYTAMHNFSPWLKGGGWSVGTTPRDHLQICDIEEYPDIAMRCGVTVTPSVALLDGKGQYHARPYLGRQTLLEVLKPTFSSAVASNDLTRVGCKLRPDLGSGINTEAGVLTCWHCVSSGKPIEVECDGEVATGTVIAMDEPSDVALISVPWTRQHPTVRLAGSNPTGVVQCVARSREGSLVVEPRTVLGADSLGGMLLVEPPFISSQSGGGLIDSNGNLAGIVSGNVVDREPYRGLIIPASAIRPLMPASVARSATPAEASPTPYAEIVRVLDLLPKPRVRFVDFGCGPEARWCIAAAEKYGCPVTGVEIDHDRAEAARERVRQAGLDNLITIIEGDAVTTDVNADVAVCYLYQQTLDQLRPKLEKMRAFASYMHRPNGLQTVQNGDTWIYTRQAMTAQTANAPRMVEYGGQLFSGPVCTSKNCAMCREIRRALGMAP